MRRLPCPCAGARALLPRPLRNTEGEVIPHPEARDGLRRQGQHEGLARVRPNLDLVRLAIDCQDRRLHCPLGRITDLDGWGPQRGIGIKLMA